jgi:uncharacterized protein YabE (DUF348 family)
MTINIAKSIQVAINDGGNLQAMTTEAETVGDLIHEQNIALAPTDKLTPTADTFLAEGTIIRIDRIVDLEVMETASIPYSVIRENDSSLYYGNEEVLRSGSEGQTQQTNLITYQNGVETKRVLLSEQVLRQPQDEIVRFGTRVEIQEEGIGRASWYAFRGCMCAAHPHYERGRYVRVTRQDTGKSIIVRINDWGPDQRVFPDRIIDLDSVAFRELSPLGAGTTLVKVELLKQ